MTYFDCEACEWRVAGPGPDHFEVKIAERKQRDSTTLWVVVRDGWVANLDRKWEYEPIPSSRDAEFTERTRVPVWEDAALRAQHMAAYPDLWNDRSV